MAGARLPLVRELLALLHRLLGFAESKTPSSLLSPGGPAPPSPGLSLAEALPTRDTCGYHQPFPNHRLQGAASLLLSFFPHRHLETNILMQRRGNKPTNTLPFMPWCIWYEKLHLGQIQSQISSSQPPAGAGPSK